MREGERVHLSSERRPLDKEKAAGTEGVRKNLSPSSSRIQKGIESEQR